ncbi:hypothetical protein ACQKCF_05755 [Psychrobacter proteolyticus]|uniref:hypothetical protein n=1 Tax=Psychrobacter proteolyticus TaxID=147825 RepID=UPI003D077284
MDAYTTAALVTATASIIVVAINTIMILKNHQQLIEDNKLSRKQLEEMNKELKNLEAIQQNQLADLQTKLDIISYVYKSNYSRRVEVLTSFYSQLAEIKLLLESFVVPLFSDSVTGDAQTLKDAARKFEELYKYSFMNLLYFRNTKKFMDSLGDLMASINTMQNEDKAHGKSAWKTQADIVISRINPILKIIGDEVREELKLDL